MTYTLVLFDLDDTLLDFTGTQAVAFEATVARYDIDGQGGALYARYQEYNRDCWRRHERGELSKTLLRSERWRLILRSAGAGHLPHEQVAESYLEELPRHPLLVAGAVEVCAALAEQVTLGVVTNGFESVQHRRLAASPLAEFISFMLTSEGVGTPKPGRPLFDRALQLGEAVTHDSVMIGDNPSSDIAGANAIGMHSIWFNPTGAAPEPGVAATHTVRRLDELLELPRMPRVG